MTVHAPRLAAPVIPGWICCQLPDGDYQADRIESLTRYQLEMGCRAEVTAPTPGELEWLCTAWTAHAEVVRRAEQAHQTAAAEVLGGSPAAAQDGTA